LAEVPFFGLFFFLEYVSTRKYNPANGCEIGIGPTSKPDDHVEGTLKVIGKVFPEEFRRAIALMVGLGALAPTNGLYAASDALHIGVSLRTKVTITSIQDLQFGDIVVGSSPSGTLTVRPDGSVVTTGSGLHAGASSPPQPGRIDITSDAGHAIDLSCTAAVVANQHGEHFPVSTTVTHSTGEAAVACSGIGSPALTFSQNQTSHSSVFIGGAINSADISGLNTLEAFSSSLPSGSPTILLAVYQ
tara:strand:- start:292 stop:1026 length:735 start_codon:yes stop_codon:yes gene_type:complete